MGEEIRMKGNNLIEGTERSEGKSYPPDWLCVCGHENKMHGAQGIQNNMCKIKNERGIWEDQCVIFTPMDNLTFIESLAKEKSL